MSLRGIPKSVRYLAASLLILGLAVVGFWGFQQHPSKAHAAAGQLVQITNFGSNPTGLQMYLYVPPSVKPHPAILLALHQCTGSGPGFFNGTQFANLADQYGFIVIFPSTPNNGNCWDVFSPKGLARNGGSDNNGLISMITYVEQHNNGDPNNVYVTGASSGAMMTDVMVAEYPDVFKAGAAFMGVPYHCFATTSGTWNSQCANGQIIMTPQQWGDLVRNDADPGYTGQWPRIELWHGTADGTLNYNNFGEEIKQWTNVHGLSQTPSSTDSPVSGWTRTRYGGTGTQPPVEGVSIAGAGHVLPENGMESYAIAFMGLNNISNNPTPTPTTGGGSTPTATATTVSGGNLLTNGGAEAGTTGWSVFGSGTLSAESNVVHSGNTALLLTGRTASWNGISQDVTSKLTNGATYTTTVWVRSQANSPSAQATLALTANGSTSYLHLAGPTTVNTSGWTLVSGTATVSWSGSLSSAVWYTETTSGTDSFYLDDASFSSGSQPPPTATPVPTNTPTSGNTPTPTPTVSSSTPTPTPTTTSGGNGVTASGVVASNSPYFGEEDIKFSNTGTITALTATITVQKTTGVSYSSAYATIGGVTMTHVDNGSTITYTFTLNSGQAISPGTNSLLAAQFSGTGTTHSTTSDLWTITTTSGGATNTLNGHF